MDEVAADTLRTALAAVPGVAAAEVRLGDGDRPVEVAVRLRDEADPQHVALAIQRLLAARGIRSRLADPPAPDLTSQLPTASPEPGAPSEEIAVVVPMKPDPPDTPVDPPSPWPTGVRAVSVEERADGLGVTVTLDDGRMGSRREIGRRDAIDVAVVASVADALGTPIESATVEWNRFEDSDVVTVVVRSSRGLTAGAAVAGVGPAHAVAAAARAALER